MVLIYEYQAFSIYYYGEKVLQVIVCTILSFVHMSQVFIVTRSLAPPPHMAALFIVFFVQEKDEPSNAVLHHRRGA